MAEESTRFLIDTSGILEHLAGSAVGRRFQPYVERSTPERAVTSTVVVYELFKKLSALHGDRRALEEILTLRSKALTMEVSFETAIKAAAISRGEGLAMADSLILATGRMAGATVLTTDEDLGKAEGARNLAKPAEDGSEGRGNPPRPPPG